MAWQMVVFGLRKQISLSLMNLCLGLLFFVCGRMHIFESVFESLLSNPNGV